MGPGGEGADHFVQTDVTGELGQPQADKLRPAGHSRKMVALVVLQDHGFEFISRDKFENLRECGVMMRQSLDLLLLQCL